MLFSENFPVVSEVRIRYHGKPGSVSVSSRKTILVHTVTRFEMSFVQR